MRIFQIRNRKKIFFQKCLRNISCPQKIDFGNYCLEKKKFFDEFNFQVDYPVRIILKNLFWRVQFGKRKCKINES